MNYISRFDGLTVIRCVCVCVCVWRADQGPEVGIYEGWNFNSGNYLFRTDTK